MQFARDNPILAEYTGYIPSSVKCLHVYKEKKLKQHYKKYYDLQVELLGFQNLENSTIPNWKGKYVCYCWGFVVVSFLPMSYKHFIMKQNG